MISTYDVQDAEEPIELQIPRYESEFMNAKMFLQLASTNTGDNLYDHLCETLNKILAERPQNVVDFFEEYSRKMKEKRFTPMTDHLEDIFLPPSSFIVANKMAPLLKPLPPEDPSTRDPADLELADMSSNNMLELLYYFEQCGLGLPRTEMFFIMLSIRKLIHSEPISSVRFWGKIFGTIKNYIIVECELKDEEYIKRNEFYEIEKETEQQQNFEENAVIIEQNRIRKALDEIAKRQQFAGEGSKYPRTLPPEPKIHYTELPEAPPEPSGVGLNKMAYYVCNGIGEPWVQLPDVTPKQIQISRQIYKSFTGNLEDPILTYPEFPGKEKNYLRAQIARITSATQISPLGYYVFGLGGMGEEDDDEDIQDEEAPGGGTSCVPNPRYEAPALKDLLDSSMEFWVHHQQFILPQGRTTWWDPNPTHAGFDEEVDEELDEEEAEVEARPKMERIEPETGPPLLTALADDAAIEAVPAWSVRCSSSIFEEFAIAVIRSNLWPGAYCFSTQGKLFQNIYLGFGLKYMEHNFSPIPLPRIEQEYPIGAEIMEISDPTGAEEEQWRIDHLPKIKEELLFGGGEEGGLEEAEEEEEDY